jgi:translation initiation factor 1
MDSLQGVQVDEATITRALIHIRNQQRSGRKSETLVEGIPEIFNLKKIVKYLKKALNCNGCLRESEEHGTILQLQGDCRQTVEEFLIREGIADKADIRNHLN